MQIEQMIQGDTQTQHTFQQAAFEDDNDIITSNEVHTYIATPKEPFADAYSHTCIPSLSSTRQEIEARKPYLMRTTGALAKKPAAQPKVDGRCYASAASERRKATWYHFRVHIFPLLPPYSDVSVGAMLLTLLLDEPAPSLLWLQR